MATRATEELGSAVDAQQRCMRFCCVALLEEAKNVAEKLNASLIDMRFVKPLDKNAILEACSSHDYIVTIEENVIEFLI